MVNLDMVGRGATDSIYNIGADKLSTEFNEIVELANNERDQMVFDYKLRPGPCPTTNALKIMRMEGLPVE